MKSLNWDDGFVGRSVGGFKLVVNALGAGSKDRLVRLVIGRVDGIGRSGKLRSKVRKNAATSPSNGVSNLSMHGDAVWGVDKAGVNGIME